MKKSSYQKLKEKNRQLYKNIQKLQDDIYILATNPDSEEAKKITNNSILTGNIPKQFKGIKVLFDKQPTNTILFNFWNDF